MAKYKPLKNIKTEGSDKSEFLQNEKELLLDYHRFLTTTLTLDISEVWVTEYLEKNIKK